MAPAFTALVPAELTPAIVSPGPPLAPLVLVTGAAQLFAVTIIPAGAVAVPPVK